MRTFVAGLMTGALLGGFVATLLSIRTPGRLVAEDAEQLADRLEQDEKLERDFSG